VREGLFVCIFEGSRESWKATKDPGDQGLETGHDRPPAVTRELYFLHGDDTIDQSNIVEVTDT
jgi:hypothetical protein